eukprot:7378731-Prymnesium_polylepis.2
MNDLHVAKWGTPQRLWERAAQTNPALVPGHSKRRGAAYHPCIKLGSRGLGASGARSSRIYGVARVKQVAR